MSDCQQLRPHIRWKTPDSVNPSQLKKGLWCLATPCEYRSISHLFGIGRSTVCEIVHNTCQVIVDELLTHYINFPSGRRLDSIVSDFNHQWGVPQCAGAIDGTHFPVCAPLLNHTDYYNRWTTLLICSFMMVLSHRYMWLNQGFQPWYKATSEQILVCRAHYRAILHICLRNDTDYQPLPAY